jgi:hypothetical protein
MVQPRRAPLDLEAWREHRKALAGRGLEMAGCARAGIAHHDLAVAKEWRPAMRQADTVHHSRRNV